MNHVAYIGEGSTATGRLLQRIVGASGSITVPAAAGWCVARALGAGGNFYASTSSNDYLGGGGGAYARTGFTVSGGGVITATPAPGNTSSTAPNASTVVMGGVTLVSAQSGYAAVDGTTAAAAASGGLATNSVGDVTRNGGAGSVVANSSLVVLATNGVGGPGVKSNTQSSQYYPGGSSAGDLADLDTLGLGSYGFLGQEFTSLTAGQQLTRIYLQSPGAGGCTYPAAAGGGFGGAAGTVTLEFYDQKPSS